MGWLSVIWDPYFGATNRKRKSIVAEEPGDRGTREDAMADDFREYKVSAAVSALMTVKKCHESESTFTLVSTFSHSLFILYLNFLHILKVWAYILLIRVQSMKVRNGLAPITNPRERGQFDVMEQRVECW